MDIYTSDQETTSYSGVHVHELVCNGLAFSISQGWCKEAKAYKVHVKHYSEFLFTITTYDGDKLYDVLEKRVDNEIAAKVIRSAFHYGGCKLLSTLLMNAFLAGKRKQKEEMQFKMREFFGIEEE